MLRSDMSLHSGHVRLRAVSHRGAPCKGSAPAVSRLTTRIVRAIVATLLLVGVAVGAPAAPAMAATPRFLTLPLASTKGMNIQQAWLWSGGSRDGTAGHDGIDYIKARVDSAPVTWKSFRVVAAAPGRACASRNGHSACGFASPGNWVVMRHRVEGRTWYTFYGHLRTIDSAIPLGRWSDARLVRGQALGMSGYSGDPCCITHLHFELLTGPGHRIDPYGLYARRERYPDPAGKNGRRSAPANAWTTNPPTRAPRHAVVTATPTGSPAVPPPDGGADGVTAISSSELGTCAVFDGRAWCWGHSAGGGLGAGSSGMSAVPVAVAELTAVSAVSAGYDHTCAIADGSAWCWGSNQHGQLGDGTTTNSVTPVEVKGPSGVTAISAGEAHTCAIADGSAWCWGSNAYGQLGDGSTTDRAVPVEVGGLAETSAISAGRGHSCAISSGRASCWGSNDHGQLGDGTHDAAAEPVQVKELGQVDAISAGGAVTCALAQDRAWCWGLRRSDPTDGSRDDSATPVEVTGPEGVTAISAGGHHGCAVAAGRAWCWGADENGQLGDGTFDGGTLADGGSPFRQEPVLVQFPGPAPLPTP
jgi:hypothetical protein